MRIGAVGLDSSHTLQFTRRIHDSHLKRTTPCHVTCCWDPSFAQNSVQADVNEAFAPLRALGVRFANSFDELLSSVDAVMVLTVDGANHRSLGLEALSRGLPAFIDKPLACATGDANALLQYTRANQSRCYSASSLRFAGGVPNVGDGTTGRLTKIEASGPFQEAAQMHGLWYYGCHTFEFVDSLWPTHASIRRIRARAQTHQYTIDLEYDDGLVAVIGLDRSGSSPFAARLHGAKRTAEFTADLTSSYDRLVASITSFFGGGKPHVPLERIVESIATIEACHASIAGGGNWIEIGLSPIPGGHAGPQEIAKNLT